METTRTAGTQILIVEDDGITAPDLSSRLQRLDYDIAAIASSGEEYIEKAATLHPELVLMDIHLKGRMDGVDAAAEIRTRRRDPRRLATDAAA